jgi:hypothetical protein
MSVIVQQSQTQQQQQQHDTCLCVDSSRDTRLVLVIVLSKFEQSLTYRRSCCGHRARSRRVRRSWVSIVFTCQGGDDLFHV